MGSREIRILNYEFSFCLFFFAGVDIHLYNGKSSAFQAEIAGMSSSAGRWPAVMKVIAFQAKVSQWIEGFHCDGFLYSRVFLAWKAEFS